jgi:chromosome partitioning protein
LDEIQASRYDVPVVIRDRESLFGGCWDQECSAFEFVEEHRSPQRDHEMETVEKLDDLAARLEAVA